MPGTRSMACLASAVPIRARAWILQMQSDAVCPRSCSASSMTFSAACAGGPVLNVSQQHPSQREPVGKLSSVAPPRRFEQCPCLVPLALGRQKFGPEQGQLAARLRQRLPGLSEIRFESSPGPTQRWLLDGLPDPQTNDVKPRLGPPGQ